jgi:membrane protein required for colicin V production
MNELDWILAAIVLLLAVRCYFRGIIAELMGLAALIASTVAAIALFNPVERLAREYVSLGWAAAPLAFLAVFAATFILMKLLEASIKKALEGLDLEGLDKGLGMLLGAIEGAALSALALLVISMQPFWDSAALLEGSFIARIALPILSSAYTAA